MFKGLEIVEEERRVVGGDDSDDVWSAAPKGSQSESGGKPSSGACVAKRNALGYLGSDDEHVLCKWGVEAIKRERDWRIPLVNCWRVLGESPHTGTRVG